ncbi:MAG TPA: GDSL-type esterase/lipase family protein, partial [Kofleriaceae bacterium]|nr:GDSL-type esterase/lipase family protein [Kofleriaceae bacterium]
MIALVGCGVGCDGERAQKTTAPRPAHADASTGAGATGGGGNGGSAETPSYLGNLDAPPGTLDALFSALAATESGDPNGRTLLLFFGDSHTAGDAMTSRLRVTWQHQFGDAGRGLVGAGKPPVHHYYQRDVRYGRSGKWTGAVGGHRGDAEPFGVAGLRVSGKSKGAQLWVETCGECQAGTRTAQFEILYYAAPDHGVLRYRVDDGAWQSLPTKTAPIEPSHPGRQVIPLDDGPHKLTLEHGGGGVLDLFGVVLERLKPGVIVDSLGVVGRRLGSLRSWDWAIIGEQLATRDPKLVVLQYGTNEADDPDLVLEDMAKYYDETIQRIRAAVPTAAILILGPPDMGVREGGKACDRVKKPPRVKDRAGSSSGSGSADVDAGVTPECEWRTPAILREIIAVEHAAALRNHVAFFDTFAAMGGADQMHGWVIAEPRVAFKDHVHLSNIGYGRWADALTGALFEEYGRWRRANGLAPMKSVTPLPSTTPH